LRDFKQWCQKPPGQTIRDGRPSTTTHHCGVDDPLCD
jgi:hypothetical protein